MNKTSLKILFVAIVFVLNPVVVIAQPAKQGVTLFKQAQDLQTKARSRDDLENALKKYEAALRIFEKAGLNQPEGVILNQIGMVYYSLGQYPKALEYYEKSLKITMKIKDMKSQGRTLNNSGIIYAKLARHEKAVECFEKSLTITKKIGDVEQQGRTLNSLAGVYNYWSQYEKAIEYLEKALVIRRKVGDVHGEGVTLNNIGESYRALGQYSKALERLQNCLEIGQKVGDVALEGSALNNIGLVYDAWGQYGKALEYFEKAISISRKIGQVRGEETTLNNIGNVYLSWGQYAKALDYYDKSLSISRKIGDLQQEGTTLNNISAIYIFSGQYTKATENLKEALSITKKIGDTMINGATLEGLGATYVQMGKFDEALDSFQEALQIYKKIGVPTGGVQVRIGNLFLDKGELNRAAPFVREVLDVGLFARFYLAQADYPNAENYYAKLLGTGEKRQDAGLLFTAYTGLGKVYEALDDYNKAQDYYEKGMKLTEEIRSGLLPSERKNFFEVKINGFYRSEPAKGLTRVRMKLNQAAQSIDSSEVTRARAFSDNIALRSERGFSGIPVDILEKEDALLSKLAALKKEILKTDKEKQPDRYENLQKEAHSAESELKDFIEMLWDKYKAYAAVKYPRPVTLKESALRPEECVVMFDVLGDGVGVKLIRDKKIDKTFYVKWDQKDLETDVVKFRKPFENLHFKEFNPDLAQTLYRKLLEQALADVPKGTPIIIIPDGSLALLPFEALVTGGKVTWNKGANGIDCPEGLTFLGDEHPISYYQSITALTLARTIGSMDKPKDQLLVIADPVFDLKDQRAQEAIQCQVAEREKKNNLELMQTIEDCSSGSFRFKRLPQTGVLADNLSKIYGANCITLTGIKANKVDFLTKIAPQIDQYGSVVFATHGVMSTHVPGLMEPFLALTMAPPGTDGFLKMSDVLSLRMNADIVALTACQSGLGRELSGEGVMSMGRAFQYAGAKSVLMSLWEVEEKSATTLAESFFRHRKEGKTRLDSLKAARDDIRKASYNHPFFWSAFILVGEAS
ncbi:MAG: CHAT domain-containing tetratricopeptide repeat protein [Desulfomonilaceae bacterium]